MPALDRKKAAEWIARVVLAAVFVAAAVPKLSDLASFAADVRNYRMLPDAAAPWLATIVPCVELAIAAALLVDRWVRGAAVVAWGLLAAFSLAMGQALVRGINIDCGCFGSATATAVSWKTLLRNAALLAVATYAFLAAHRRLRRDP
ncbi:MAG: MauE/DoxX family redox-associated membrane protein [Polyangiales bacterium]|nr:DoxX family membrane protein [Myxococcales bacterium]